MLFKLIIICAIIWLVLLRWSKKRKIQCFSQFRNDIFSLPLVGHSYMLIGNGEGTPPSCDHVLSCPSKGCLEEIAFSDKAARFKMNAIQALGREAMKQDGVTTLQSWVLDQFYAMTADAEIAEIILRSCLEKDDSMKLFQSIFGSGLLVSPVPEWRMRRKVLNPAFTTKNLNKFVHIFGKNSAFLTEQLQEVAKSGPFSIYEHINTYSLDSIFELAKTKLKKPATSCIPAVGYSFDDFKESIYGFEIGAQKNPQHPIMKAMSVCCELVANRMCLPWLHNQTVYEMTSQFTTLKKNAELLFNFIDEKIIKKCKELKTKHQSEKDPKTNEDNKTKTILELMVEFSSKNNGELSEVYLREETFLVTFAGTETTSIALSYIMLMMSRHPDVQENVYQEIIQVLGDSKKPIKAEDLPHLKYTEAVIKETMRMYPPVPIVLRKIDKDIELPSGKYLVAGTGAMINIWAIHHNPLYWKEPEQFRPDRFLETTAKHPAAFLPFSYGVRNCIGVQYAMMSLKTSVSSLIRQYQVLPVCEDPKAMHQPIRLQFDVMMKDVDNFTVQLKRR